MYVRHWSTCSKREYKVCDMQSNQNQNKAIKKAYYGIDELKDRWGIGRSTVYDLINDGELSSVKIRSRRLIPVASVAEYEAKISQ